MFNIIKPMLAEDYEEDKIPFPIGIQPKIDGVRGLNLTGKLTGRSLKCHRNIYHTSYFSRPIFLGLDGELASLDECHPSLCRITTGNLNRIQGESWMTWHLFDYIVPETINLIYEERYARLEKRFTQIQIENPDLSTRLRVVPMFIARNIEQLRAQDEQWLAAGYEGTILRRLDGLYKQGRSTVKEAGLLRIKHFTEEDAIVIDIIEGNANNNIAIKNQLGRTERSSSKANLVSNGLIGSLICKDIKTGKIITVAAGSMDHKERKFYFENPKLIINQVIKYKCFPKGVLNKPRFPTFQSFRIQSDLIF